MGMGKLLVYLKSVTVLEYKKLNVYPLFSFISSSIVFHPLIPSSIVFHPFILLHTSFIAFSSHSISYPTFHISHFTPSKLHLTSHSFKPPFHIPYPTLHPTSHISNTHLIYIQIKSPHPPLFLSFPSFISSHFPRLIHSFPPVFSFSFSNRNLLNSCASFT